MTVAESLRGSIVALVASMLVLVQVALAQPAGALSAPAPASAPNELLLAVEIPAGGMVKYELRPDGLIEVDRFHAMPVAWPANYGSVTATMAADGDALDALVLTRQPLQPGVLLRFRPVGILRMLDGGVRDDKLVGVPVSALDPYYDDIAEVADLPASERERIEAFFRTYKQLPAGSKPVRLDGWGDAAAARASAAAALARAEGN